MVRHSFLMKKRIVRDKIASWSATSSALWVTAESFKERFKQSEGKGWKSKMAVYMKDWFGGRNDMLHYLRTGELQHRMGRE